MSYSAPANRQLRKRSNKRQTVHLTIWVKPSEKAELQRLASLEGLSISATGKAILMDGLQQKLRIQREVLAQPVLEATIHKEMNRLMNNLSQFHGRSLFEIGQIRWLFVNKLFREVINPEKKFTKEEFYTLLDTSQTETIKSVKQWNPNIQDVVGAIKQFLKEGEDKQT